MLRITNLTKKYGDKIAVDDISIDVNPGEIFGFVGHNGAGKTTTIKCIVGILSFEKGNIYIDGLNIKDDPIKCKSMMAYIPDNPDVYENLTGIQYLNFVGDVYSVNKTIRRELIDKYAKELEIYDNLGSVISSYSHGMKQKIAIISALIHSPKILILDEPFVGLDPKAQFKLKEIMKELCDKGVSIFFSSHVLEVVQKLCDKIAIINKGKIVKIGKIEDITKDASLEDVFMSTLGDE
ncbi:MAG: ABC-type multidrug transport system, ATPase component [Clostridia bacterium]|jgi:ABC-2 type transport system ATP-binding protein|nr:ABC-type multidrug transport system, ATPase component [Clostridia bacterium]